MTRDPSRRRPRLARRLRTKDSFSLLELVVVVAVLAILSSISLPFFQSLIKHAAYVAGQWSLASAGSSCAVNKSASVPTGFFGTQFSSSNTSSICDGDMTASFDGGCQISIDLRDGAKTSLGLPGWPKSLDQCNQNSTPDVNKDSTPEPSRPQKENNSGENNSSEEKPCKGNPLGYKIDESNVLLEEPGSPYTVCTTTTRSSSQIKLRPWEACTGDQPCNSAGQPVITGISVAEQVQKCRQLQGL